MEQNDKQHEIKKTSKIKVSDTYATTKFDEDAQRRVAGLVIRLLKENTATIK